MVAIAYNSGVALCEQYEGAIKICQYCSRCFPRSIYFEQWLSWLAILNGRMSTTKLKKNPEKNNEEKLLKNLMGLYLKYLLVYLTWTILRTYLILQLKCLIEKELKKWNPWNIHWIFSSFQRNIRKFSCKYNRQNNWFNA